MNGVDINRFQFEYDLTWMSFFQSPNGATYLRYGGRSDANAESYMNRESLIAAMKTAIQLHESGATKPNNQFEPQPTRSKFPEEIKATRDILARRKNKCIHCHEVKAAQLTELRKLGQLKKEMIFTYPDPIGFGTKIDAKSQTRIASITDGSASEDAGLQVNDKIVAIQSQTVHTYADITRILELTNSDKLTLDIIRDDQKRKVNLNLPTDWKRGDASWRATSHIVGPNTGFWGVKLSKQQKARLDIPGDQLGIKITAIWGQWARQAKVKHGDILIRIDGRNDDWSIKQAQTYLQMNRQWNDQIELTVLRKGQENSLKMRLPPMPEH